MQFTRKQEVFWVYKIAAAGDILAEVWSEGVNGSYPVVVDYLSPPENIREAMIFMEGEEWKAKHVMQSQYMSQIAMQRQHMLWKMANQLFRIFPA